MTESAINPSINIQFPALHDNDSQVFRDNFTNIKSSLTTAKLELSDLLTNSIRSDSLITDVNNLIVKNQINGIVADYRYDVPGLQLQTFEIDYNNGPYQTVQVGADVGIKLKNFPSDVSTTLNVGKLRLHIAADNSARKVEFISSAAVIKYQEEFPFVISTKLGIASSLTKDPTVVDIWQVNNKTSTPTIYIKYVGLFRQLSTTN